MKKILQITVIAFLLVAAVYVAPIPVFADSEMPPTDFVKQTENGRYLFVMLVPEEWARFNRSDIREWYEQSGLYRNDGSFTPLWTVNWYASDVYPCSDGRHVVRMGPLASNPGQLAVAFYRDGEKLKAYNISDLVRDESKLRQTASHFFWETSLRYSDKEGSLFITTVDGRSYRFSVKTGEIEKEGGELNPMEKQPF